MKKTLLATTLATITLISASSAFAADTVDLSVGGTIAPVACVPTLSSSGTLDYGDIKAGTLKTDEYTLLPVKTLDFSMTCDGKTKVAVSAVNGRPGTAAGATNDGANGGYAIIPPIIGSNIPVAGLGLTGTAKIGGYTLKINSIAEKTQPNSFGITRPLLSASWRTLGLNTTMYAVSTQIQFSVGTNYSTKIPVAVKTLTAMIDVQSYINKASALNITQPIKLDGLTTLELTYL
ncbi:DUF1120 domain-containing protein [Serratia proteamaculans]|uniref:DUF1120 domain-containing protein n=1 Tax=Serratia proteamaculans TaxID=28151 RepID=UPI002177065C|nr:DUF1120 domain-containing protein [Serratia proteamaculans]CAI1574170.1 Protein of uncharacterised function (DUF1120) [Serratia proteamaculans]